MFVRWLYMLLQIGYVFVNQIILLVYDVTNSSSFDILEEWQSKIKSCIDAYNDEIPLIALIGNKCDMEHQRTVKRERSHRFAAENGFPYHDMSARTGESVIFFSENVCWKHIYNIWIYENYKNFYCTYFQVSLCIAGLAAQVLGVRLTRTDQDFHKPIIIAEIGDTVDVNSIHKVVKRIPNKKQHPIVFHPHFPASKSAVCVLQ